MIDASRLEIGTTYYMPTYPDQKMVAPIILTYTYLGTDLDLQLDPDPPQGSEAIDGTPPRPRYYFRFLPPFQHDSEPEEDEVWPKVLPHLFAGWGEPVPSVFPADRLSGLLTLAELIDELQQVQRRLR